MHMLQAICYIEYLNVIDSSLETYVYIHRGMVIDNKYLEVLLRNSSLFVVEKLNLL